MRGMLESRIHQRCRKPLGLGGLAYAAVSSMYALRDQHRALNALDGLCSVMTTVHLAGGPSDLGDADRSAVSLTRDAGIVFR